MDLSTVQTVTKTCLVAHNRAELQMHTAKIFLQYWRHLWVVWQRHVSMWEHKDMFLSNRTHLCLIHTCRTTCAMWVDVHPRTWSYIWARGRPWTLVLQLHAIVKYMLIMVVLRDTAWTCSKNHATPRINWARVCERMTAISVSAVIEINVFDYNATHVHTRCVSVALSMSSQCG